MKSKLVSLVLLGLSLTGAYASEVTTAETMDTTMGTEVYGYNVCRIYSGYNNQGYPNYHVIRTDPYTGRRETILTARRYEVAWNAMMYDYRCRY